MGTYFNMRGRAEPTRLILAQAGAEYEEVRIPWGGFTPSEEWLKVKPSVPMGQVPFMEVDGKMICQSMAIARYCAKKYGLAGATDLEAALADQHNSSKPWTPLRTSSRRPWTCSRRKMMPRNLSC